MARVTIEDCMEVIDNRFALCVVAMKRAKQIVKGKVERLEKERKLAEAAAESEEIPSPEVMEMNIDRSYKDHEEENPIISSIREIADGTVKSTYEELKGS